MSKHTVSRPITGKLADITGLPLDTVGVAPVFQMCSDREMIVEGAKNLEYYDENTARIRTNQLNVCIGGKDLIIKCLANKNIAVCGLIDKIELERYNR